MLSQIRTGIKEQEVQQRVIIMKPNEGFKNKNLFLQQPYVLYPYVKPYQCQIRALLCSAVGRDAP